MRALLASPLGLLVGLAMGALGGGGSILAVPALVYVAGQEPRAAITTSLVVVGLAAVAGVSRHWRAGRVRLGVGLGFGACGVGGSIAGSALSQRLDPDVLLLGFAGLVLVAAWRMLTGCPTCTRVGEDRAEADPDAGRAVPFDVATAAKVVGAGTVVGFFTGLFGVGGGFIAVPALTLLLGFAMPEAIGTSLVIIAVNAGVALAARLGGGIEWSITIPFALASLAGVVAGSHLSSRVGATTLLRAFAGLLMAVAVYTAADAGLALT